jgi:hypothetical protein
MGETAAPGTGGSEVDADVVQVQAPLDIGSIVHPAPPLIESSTALCRGLVHRDLQERCWSWAMSATFRLSCLLSVGNVMVV